jgi:hypothetical protein
MSWRWEQLPPLGTRCRVHLLAFSHEQRPGMIWTPIDKPLRELASRDLGIDVGEAQYAEAITAEVLDPPNLDHLRDAWRRAASAEASFVLDVLARRWWTVLPFERPFFVENELSLNFEGQPTGKLGHLAHTVGMAKFGRPELAIAGLTPDDGPAGAELLLLGAKILASGGTLKVGPRIFETIRVERNTLPIAAPHLVLRDAGMGPPTVRKYLAQRRLRRG